MSYLIYLVISYINIYNIYSLLITFIGSKIVVATEIGSNLKLSHQSQIEHVRTLDYSFM